MILNFPVAILLMYYKLVILTGIHLSDFFNLLLFNYVNIVFAAYLVEVIISNVGEPAVDMLSSRLKSRMAIVESRNRLKGSSNEEEIILFSEAEIKYYENLSKYLGTSARYQLLGTLFANMKIRNLDTSIPVIEGKMWGIYLLFFFY